jgi:hypothetical protein
MRHLRLWAALGVVVLGAALAGTARADLLNGQCGSTAQVFAPWDDQASYYFPANGGFENGSAGWSLGGGAQVVGDNESAYVHAAGDSHALAIPSGGSASVSLCYGASYPALRFFAKGDGATVHVSIQTRNLLGIVSTLDGGTFQAGSDWAPSPRMSTLLSAAIALLGPKSMTLRIDVSGAPAEIDDLYVDPLLVRS